MPQKYIKWQFFSNMWPFNSILCQRSDIFFSWSCWWKWHLCDYAWGNNYYIISHGKTWPVRSINYKVKVTQSCLTLCNPLDYTVHGIPQVRILEWVAFPFSGGFSQPRDQTQVSCIAGGFFTSRTTREAHGLQNQS